MSLFKPEDFGNPQKVTSCHTAAKVANARRDAEMERLRTELNSQRDYCTACVTSASEENRRLRQALEFFANRESYVWVDLPLSRVLAVKCEEPWVKARAALGEGPQGL